MPSAPLRVPGHELLGELGRGGMGVVYRARQVRLNRLVALKMILAGGHAGEQERARFQIEAEAVARLQHPNIVQIYEVGEADGRPFLSLEFVDGISLDRRLAAMPLPPRRAAELVETLADAMHYAHERGVVHRDLKPANILIGPDGQPKITDFGLAKQLDLDTGQTRSGAVMGTPSYMAPEQAAGMSKAIGPATDVYALGAILYELLTGRPPFKGDTLLETLEQVRTRAPVPPRRFGADVPRDLETVCLKCLQKEPGERYASAQDLADDLRRFLADEPIRARRVGVAERLWRWRRRRPLAANLVEAVVVLLVVGALYVLWPLVAGDPETRAVRAAGQKIRPIHEQKAAARPGDWLSRDPETGQTFDQFLAAKPSRPGGELTTLYVLPLGDFDGPHQRLLGDTEDFLHRFFGLPVRRLDRLSLTAIPPQAFRTHPRWGDRQASASSVLEQVRARRPTDAVGVLALTTSDLWTGSEGNFLFGLADPAERVSVGSVYRLGDPAKDYTVCLRRTLKLAIQETGNLLGMAHCTAYECGMNGCAGLAELDRNPLAFCPECEQKVWWACRLDPLARYETLIDFAREHGLAEEAGFWKAHAAAVRGR
jgi:predicted Zn-dependent protease